MADHDQGAGILLQRFLERFDAFEIQVTGGLIQQQHVGRLQHDHREQTANALTTGEHLDRLLHVFAREEHAPEHRAHLVDVLAVGEL